MGNKTQAIIIVILIIAAISGYLVWELFFQKSAEEKVGDVTDKSIEAATGGTLPTFDTQSNPLEEMPEINPVDKANPFKGITTNPFE